MTALRAAVIGLGVGEQHARAYEAHPDCELVAVCDLDESKLAAWGQLRTTTDATELLADPEIDVVSVASYDDAHFGQVSAALENGKHVFAEKPLVMRPDEAAAVRELLRANAGLRLTTNVPLRLSPRFQHVRERIQAGELGELFHLEADYDYGRRHKLTDGWRGRIPYYSVVLGGAIHMVDLLMWMSGERFTEVAAAVASGTATRGTAFEHPDFTSALLRTERGTTVKVNANLGCVSPHFHGVRIYGTEGTFVNDLPDGKLFLREDTGFRAEAETHAYPGAAKGDLIAPFVASILHGADPVVPESEVFEVLAVCFAIEQAAASGGPVAVDRFL